MDSFRRLASARLCHILPLRIPGEARWRQDQLQLPVGRETEQVGTATQTLPMLSDRHAGLVPRRDMEPDGFRRNIHANVMFVAWLDGIPGRHFRASGIIQFIFLMS